MTIAGWVLIMWLGSRNSTIPVVAYFQTQAACEKARDVLKQRAWESTSVGNTSFCTPTGDAP